MSLGRFKTENIISEKHLFHPISHHSLKNHFIENILSQLKLKKLIMTLFLGDELCAV